MLMYHIPQLYDNVDCLIQLVEHDDTIQFEVEFVEDQKKLNVRLFVRFHLQVHR